MSDRMRASIIGLIAQVALSNNAANAEKLTNGYNVIQLAAESSPSLGCNSDGAIADMNDFGQVLATSKCIQANGSFFDGNKRLAFFPADGHEYQGSFVSAPNREFLGISNRGVASVRKRTFGFGQQFLVTGLLSQPCAIGGFACEFGREGSIAEMAFGFPWSSQAETISLASVNARTDDVVFALQDETEIAVHRDNSVTTLIQFADLPVQYRGGGRFYGFADGREADAESQRELMAFDDGSVAFVVIDPILDKTWVLEWTAAGAVRELFSLPGQSGHFAINDDRQIAFALNQPAGSYQPGVYLHDAGAITQITSIPLDASEQVIELAISDAIPASRTNTRGAQVAFNMQSNDPFSMKLQVYRNGGVQTLATNLIDATGTGAFYTSSRLDSWSFNNAGQLAIAVFDPSAEVSAGFEARRFYRFDPPGTARENPLLPGQQCAPDRFCFRQVLVRKCFPIGSGGVGPAAICWSYYDPIVAIGYDFEATSGQTRFGGFEAPMAGDGIYDLFLWNAAQNAYVDSGINVNGLKPFVFESIGFPEGVDRFSLRGIEVEANLDPNDTDAFVTALGFSTLDEQSFEMIPVRFDTDAIPPTVQLDAPADRSTLYAGSFPASVNVAFSVGHAPLDSIKTVDLAVNNEVVAASARPFAAGSCASSATAAFDSCTAVGDSGSFAERIVVATPGTFEITASAETDGGPGSARSAISVATINVEYPAPPAEANRYINEKYKKMNARCRGGIVSEIARRHGSLAYGSKGGPYDISKIRSDVDILKAQLKC